MSQNGNDPENSDYTQIKSLFQAAKDTELEPSPYLRVRVLASLQMRRSSFLRVNSWKLVSAVSTFALVLVSTYALNLQRKAEPTVVAQQSYVIHVNFSEDDMTRVVKAEVVLPEGVGFVSKKGLTDGKKSLRLPIDIKSTGRGKLPFVVTSTVGGEQKILVRLLDEQNHLVREQYLKFKFAQNGTDKNINNSFDHLIR
ncbi:MAG: hypothetical protein JNM39_04640 [Bdellovibrionaceae bacterium]|nr:hypothetical protein [Pseudobdellovibrionaceae bacterium]